MTCFTLEIIVNCFVDRCIGHNLLCVGNVHQTIVDCFVLEAFREYRDDLRDHIYRRQYPNATKIRSLENNVVANAII